MFNINIGNIRWRMALDFIASIFTTVVVVQTTPFNQIFLPHTNQNIIVSVPPYSPKYLKHELPGCHDEPVKSVLMRIKHILNTRL